MVSRVVRVRTKNGIIHFYGHHRESCKIAVDLMHRLRMDNDTIREVSILVENHDVRVEPSLPAVKRMMARTGEVLFEKLLILQTADNMAKNLEHFPEKKNRIDASMQIYKQILAERQPVSCFASCGKRQGPYTSWLPPRQRNRRCAEKVDRRGYHRCEP